jgi:hypothetical protein
MPGIDPAILAQMGNNQAYPGSPPNPVDQTGGGDQPQSLQAACEAVVAQLQELASAMDDLQGQAEMSEEDIDPATEQSIGEAASKVAEASDTMTQVLSTLSGSSGYGDSGPAKPPGPPAPKGPPAV